MLMYKEKEVYQEDNYRSITRGVTRGITKSVSRGATRGGSQQDSDAGRFGFGNKASTNSTESKFKHLPGSEKYVMPLRVRILSNSETTNINCSQTLKGASVNELRMKTMVVPF